MKVWFSLVFGLFYATVLKLLAKARHLPVSSLDFCVGNERMESTFRVSLLFQALGQSVSKLIGYIALT